jgi:hypothetical protein
MANPATTADLAARWRPLTTAETTVGTTLLGDAYGMLVRRVPNLDARVTANADGFAAVVVRVLATAVLRVMKNPDGKRSESIDDYTWQRDQAISAGVLYFTDDEMADLMPVDPDEKRGGAYSVDLLSDYAARLAE